MPGDAGPAKGKGMTIKGCRVNQSWAKIAGGEENSTQAIGSGEDGKGTGTWKGNCWKRRKNSPNRFLWLLKEKRE